MGAVFLLFALRSYAKGGAAWPWLLGTGAALALIAMTRPAALAPLNRSWLALGKLLNRVVSPVVLALLFFGVVCPVGALMRLSGSDPLRLKRAGIDMRDSYWLAHEPLASDHFTRQF